MSQRALAPVAAIVFAGAMMAAAPALAQRTAPLSGEWQGAYVSDSGADVNTFTVKLTQSGPSIKGTMIELNVFGDSSQALFLTSTLEGAASGNIVNFVKMYDGSGGVSHSVSYTGTLEPNGRRIRGTFTVDGNSGRFELVR